MGFLVIIPFGALATWAIFAIHRWLRQGNYGREWWRAFTLLCVAGVVVGIWFAGFLHYEVAKRASLTGFPVPVNISTRQKPDGDWEKSDMPVPVKVGGMIVDFISGIAVALAPIAVAAFFKENRGKMSISPSGPN